MMTQRKKLVFFDWDGTLCHGRFWESFRQEKSPFNSLGLKIEQLLFSSQTEMVQEWMRGKYTSEEISHHVSNTLHVPYELIWKQFIEDCTQMRVIGTALQLIGQIREDMYVCLITNNMDSFDRFTVPANNLSTHFDAIVNSYNEKKLKTDDGGSLFTTIAQKFNIPMESTYLIDDSEKVCGSYTFLGGTALHVSKKYDTIRHTTRLLKRTRGILL